MFYMRKPKLRQYDHTPHDSVNNVYNLKVIVYMINMIKTKAYTRYVYIPLHCWENPCIFMNKWITTTKLERWHHKKSDLKNNNDKKSDLK